MDVLSYQLHSAGGKPCLQIANQWSWTYQEFKFALLQI